MQCPKHIENLCQHCLLMEKNYLRKNYFSLITSQTPIATRKLNVLVNKNQFTNNVTGSTPISHKLDFYDKDVDELNHKQNSEVKVRQNCVGVH